MSHIVTIQSKVNDAVAVASACQRLGLPAPAQGTAQLFSGEVSGLILQLPGWQYPAVIDTSTGAIQYDNFEGAWGDQKELDRFLQAYAVERTKIVARQKGYTVSEHALNDGSIRLQINEAG